MQMKHMLDQPVNDLIGQTLKHLVTHLGKGHCSESKNKSISQLHSTTVIFQNRLFLISAKTSN